jgi:parallel beta-helix repeat protein
LYIVKKNIKKVTLVSTLLVLLIASIFIFNLNRELNNDSESVKNKNFYPKLSTNHTDHEPILIANDTAFNDQASAEGWFGDGTPENPFVIENYKIINVTVNSSAIAFVNTSLSFILRNIIIEETNNNSFGMFFNNIRGEIIIENNHISRARNEAIFIDNCTSMTIRNNIIVEGYWHALVVFGSPHTYIINNTVGSLDPNRPNQGSGVYLLDRSHNSQVINNTISQNYYSGLVTVDSSNLLIHNNTIDHNTLRTTDFFQLNGFGVFDAFNITVTMNTVTFNRGLFSWGGVEGLSFGNITNGLIYDNLVTKHMGLGIVVFRSQNLTIYLNQFEDNANQWENWGVNIFGVAWDNSGLGNNSWSYNGIGNYWDDYLGNDNDGDGIGDEYYIVNTPNPDPDADFMNQFMDAGIRDDSPIMSPDVLITLRPDYVPPEPTDTTESTSTSTSSSTDNSNNKSSDEEGSGNVPGFELIIGIFSLSIYFLIKSRKKK